MNTFPNVLILEADERRCRQIADALEQLGVVQVLQAATADVALALLRSTPGVGIGLCGLDAGQLEALALAGHEGRLSALVLMGNSSELHRQARRLSQVGRLPILGCLDLPMRGHELANILARYSATRRNDAVLPAACDLRAALERDEFQARFQPIFELPSGEPKAVELGVVWNHPCHGEVPARDFLPALVAYDLVDRFFDLLLDQGLGCLASLDRHNSRLRLAVSLQASQLCADDFVERLLRRLAQHLVAPERMIFELGENGLLNLPNTALEQLNRLRVLGCGLSVDQFGSGFSSLQLLCRRPFQQLKLAPEFASELDTPSGRALITSTLALARSLNMQVVVGGVSKPSQHEALLELGCPRGQGSYYASTMDYPTFREWLKAY
ncbi:EAL domain-containing protein [Pseudomonas nitroreducens]|uniref:EAL domain-containing protein n=1 Tax=Pseudomonas nitroreducens TaxID=46680 RepID=UPI00265B4A8C|nr:EAL domain-containing protein [Pseudomonas nitroreducens]MCP1649822.1 EAL domain-containing protein (putative c-di-GMP-specific phosphodiesterase class I) [Pseudomonas nitroreducens]MCP1687449.1 EAL domain-containing protein (putative c-di-GMP-specific phosphodiesterase class I) [Pseudomonas nitroreducens]